MSYQPIPKKDTTNANASSNVLNNSLPPPKGLAAAKSENYVEIRFSCGVHQIYPKPKPKPVTSIKFEQTNENKEHHTVTDTGQVKIEKILVEPKQENGATIIDDPESPFIQHKVHPNDDLDALAVRYHTTISQIRRYNRRVVFDSLANVCGEYIVIPRPNRPVNALPPPDPEAEAKRIRKEKIRLFLTRAGNDCDESEALFYLDENGFDVEKAYRQYYEDLQWEKQHPNPNSQSKHLKTQTTGSKNSTHSQANVNNNRSNRPSTSLLHFPNSSSCSSKKRQDVQYEFEMQPLMNSNSNSNNDRQSNMNSSFTGSNHSNTSKSRMDNSNNNNNAKHESAVVVTRKSNSNTSNYPPLPSAPLFEDTTNEHIEVLDPLLAPPTYEQVIAHRSSLPLSSSFVPNNNVVRSHSLQQSRSPIVLAQ